MTTLICYLAAIALAVAWVLIGDPRLFWVALLSAIAGLVVGVIRDPRGWR